MANYYNVIESQKALESLLMKKMTEFEKQLKASIPGSNVSVAGLYDEFSCFKDHVWSILSLLRQQISDLNQVVDNIEMRHRRKYLLFNGVPEEPNEDLSNSISDICNDKLGVRDVTKDKIIACHRLGKHSEGKHRPVLVRFVDLNLKTAVWKKKASLKGSPFVLSEFLTHQRQSLFLLARKRLWMKNCWTLDGNIIVKLPDGTRHRIDTEESLSKLTVNTDVAAEAPSSGNQDSSSGYNSKPKRAVRAKK
ncbi:unnamed protein product [Danaus chrysippus]|uniref:(African queen) hypothetical protein n=1 Tax=Danaus chrysippus TaxID=151541 RepID=A0A8J2QUC8_9NEOP|nr:unnamed protein product [Danaus chrysippus]